MGEEAEAQLLTVAEPVTEREHPTCWRVRRRAPPA
jgi:hypothetical protein